MASSLGDVYLKNNKKNKAIIPIKNPFFPYSISDIGDHASPTFAHLDNDEYPDAVVNLNTFTNIQAVFNSSIDDVLKQRKQGKKSLQDSALLNILNERHYGTFGMFYYAPYGGDSPGPTIHQTLIDFDGDGNLDLFYGSINGGIYHVKGKKPKGQLAVSSYPRWPIFTSNRNKPEYILISGAKHSKPAPIDIDNDGDTDLIVGTQDGTLYLLTNDNKNTKTTLGQFSQPRAISGKNGTITFGGKYATPTAADVNDDGLQDLFVGSESGDIYFYKALGYKSKTSKKPSLFFDKPIKNPFGIQKVGRHSVPALADTDQDGDLELYIGTEDGNTHVFDFPSKEKPTISFKTQPGSYKVGQTIQIAVKFSDRVDVDTRIFIPTLKLNSGINAEAVYTSGSGSDTLIFNYKVAKGDQTISSIMHLQMHFSSMAHQ